MKNLINPCDNLYGKCVVAECQSQINVVMWRPDTDGIAHVNCLSQEQIDDEEWIDTDEMMYSCDNSGASAKNTGMSDVRKLMGFFDLGLEDNEVFFCGDCPHCKEYVMPGWMRTRKYNSCPYCGKNLYVGVIKRQMMK